MCYVYNLPCSIPPTKSKVFYFNCFFVFVCVRVCVHVCMLSRLWQAVAILWIVGMVSLVPGKIAEEVENAFAEAKEDKEDKVVTPGSRDLDQQNNVCMRTF